MKFNFNMKRTVNEYLLLTIGAIFFTIGIQVIILPGKLTSGGVGGISLILHYLFNTPVGLVMLLLNIPLYILGYYTVNREFVFKTIYVVVISSVLIDMLNSYSFPSLNDKFLAAIFGGIVIGIGNGICYAQGGSSGGLDIVCKAINKKYGISLGVIGLIFNFFVVAALALTTNLSSALYTIISIFTNSRIIDAIQTGLPTKITFIISDKSEIIMQTIVEEIGRGVTVLKGEGAYTHAERDVLLCAIHWVDLYRVKKLVACIDPKAFIMISDASEILGKGFKACNAK